MPWPGEQMLERARQRWRSEAADDAIFPAEIPSSTTAAECLRLAELARGRRVLEVGTYFGRSTVSLASTAKVVHTVDVHPADEVSGDDTLAALMANLDRYDMRHKVVVHVGFSQLILPLFTPKSFDLVFLDAQHQREPVEEDLATLLPLVAEGGVVAFHDYGVPGVEHRGRWDPFGVTEVVDAFVRERGLDLELVDTLAVTRLRSAI